MKPTHKSAILPLLALALTAGCDSGDPTPASARPKGGNRPQESRSAAWLKSVQAYPAPVIWRSSRTLPPFAFSRDRVLAMMVQKLDGASSKASFDHIRAAFGGVPQEDAVRVLGEAIDRLIGAGIHERPILQNTCEAAAAVGSPRLVGHLKRAAMVRSNDPSTTYHQGIQRTAIEALGNCATPEQCADLWDWYFGDKGQKAPGARGQVYLLRTLVKIQGEKAAPYLKRILQDPLLRSDMRSEVLGQVQKVPAAVMAPLLAPLFAGLHGQDKLVVARILHAAGKGQGTAYLRDLMRKVTNPGQRAVLVEALGAGPGPEWIQEILPYANDNAIPVKVAVIQAIRKAPGKLVDDTLEILANSPRDGIRRPALVALLERGVRTVPDQLLETFRTGTGSPAMSALSDLLVAGDKRLLPLLLERLPGSKGVERFNYMRGLIALKDPAGVPALMAVFKEPRHILAKETDNLTYAARALSNIPAAAPVLLKAIGAEFKEDVERRYHALATLSRIISLPSAGEALRERVMDFVMNTIKDEEADPRDRIVLPRLFLNFITLDRVMRLKRVLARTRDSHVRQGLNLFLWEYFGRPERKR